uniref:Reverse transcriptase domain-containing protein n=1 Tax=Tanacetum cinerariifolium TaxID=118510 RepID=A0A699K9Y6_TANCI|nr:reverse transcriptase domain-containing protein [Tanacetum cinerariifolium]
MIFNIDSAIKHSYSNDDTCFSTDEILEEVFDALLDEGSKILHSIEGTLLEEKIFLELDEFMAMTVDENFESESDTEEPPLKKIPINTSYKIKISLEEPHTDLELKPILDNLEYVFLEEPSFLFVIISSKLSAQNKSKLVSVLKIYKEEFSWKTTNILATLKELPTATIVVYDNLIQKKAYNALVLCLSVRCLREITKETTGGKSLFEHIDEFYKLVDFLYGWDTFKVEDVLVTLNSKELQKMKNAKGDSGEGLYVRGDQVREIWSIVQIVSGQSHMEEAADSSVVYVSLRSI